METVGASSGRKEMKRRIRDYKYNSLNQQVNKIFKLFDENIW